MFQFVTSHLVICFRSSEQIDKVDHSYKHSSHLFWESISQYMSRCKVQHEQFVSFSFNVSLKACSSHRVISSPCNQQSHPLMPSGKNARLRCSTFRPHFLSLFTKFSSKLWHKKFQKIYAVKFFNLPLIHLNSNYFVQYK